MMQVEALAVSIDIDQVIRGEGMDPEVVRRRRPSLIQAAEKALELGLPAITPKVIYDIQGVQFFRHNRLQLENGAILRGEPVVQHLAGAEQVILMACTLGGRLELLAAKAMQADHLLGLALDGLGNAALQRLCDAAGDRFAAQFAAGGQTLGSPLYPGMAGWDALHAQEQLFRALQPAPEDVGLLPGGQLIPVKSLTMVIGVGKEMKVQGEICAACSMGNTCQYRERTEIPH